MITALVAVTVLLILPKEEEAYKYTNPYNGKTIETELDHGKIASELDKLDSSKFQKYLESYNNLPANLKFGTFTDR